MAIKLPFFFPVLIFAGLVACVKQPSTDPVPTLEYKNMDLLGKTTLGTSQGARDTAVLVLRYSDGDGDLFRNSSSDGPNLVYTTYAFHADSNKFVMDGFPNPATITQPANGYYKGKAIHGDIYIPMRQFRSSDAIKVLRFEAYMVDMKNHKSDVVTTPAFTVNP